MFFVGENLWAKNAQKLFGQVWGNSGKNTSHPSKFACPYTFLKNGLCSGGFSIKQI